MQKTPLNRVVDIKLWIVFWLTIITIPAISYTGRRLQYWFEGTIGKQETGWLIVVLLVITATSYIAKFVKNLRNLWWRLLLIIVLLTAIFQYVPVAEERIHFILFGLLGYLGITLFGLWKGLLICIIFSVGDEFFQWLLPDRVGDIRDVIFNIVASSIGIILAMSERRE